MGEGNPVLIVHGAGGGFDQGLDMTGALAGHGYRLIVPSRFGYLRSALPDKPTVAMQADTYVALLDRLGADKVVVVSILRRCPGRRAQREGTRAAGSGSRTIIRSENRH